MSDSIAVFSGLIIAHAETQGLTPHQDRLNVAMTKADLEEVMESASLRAERHDQIESSALQVGAILMLVGAIAYIGYAIWFLIRNFTDTFLELGIGPAQVDVGKAQISEFSPSLLDYISHLHIAVSGFIAATAVAVLFLVWFGVRRGAVWAWVGAVVAPVVGLVIAIPSHYPYGLATIGHLGLIYLATAVFVVGAVVALMGLRDVGALRQER